MKTVITNKSNDIKKFRKLERKTAFMVLIFTLVVGTLGTYTIYAANNKKVPTRRENVYVELSNEGKVDAMSMYVDMMLNENKKVVDYGRFYSVENMTNKIKPTYDKKGNLVWNLEKYNGEAFSYNVKLNKKLERNIPYTLDISYELNGVETSPKKLAHKNGLIKVKLNINPNKKADKFYQNNYMMEITSDFDMNDYVSVTSDDAIEMMTGKTKTLMWVVLPGSKKEIELMLGTEDFRYDGLTFAILPIDGEVSEKVVDLIKDKKDIEDAYNSSINSTTIVLDALGNMTTGFYEAAKGLDSLKDGTIKMHALRGKRDMTVAELDSEIATLEQDLDQTSKHLENSKAKVEDFFTTLDSANKEIHNISVSLSGLEDSLDDLEKVAGNMKRDISDIRGVMRETSGLMDDSRELIKLLIKSANADSASIENKTKKLAQNLQSASSNMQTAAGEIMASGGNPAVLQEVGDDLISAGSNLQSLANDLNKLSKISQSEVNILDDLERDLKDLSRYIDDVELDLKELEKDAPVFEDTIAGANSLVGDLRAMSKIAEDYSSKVITYKDDVNSFIDTGKNLTSTLSKVSQTLKNSMPTIKSSLNILSTELYNGAISSTSGLSSVTKQMKNVTSQSKAFIDAKNKLDKVVRNNWNDIDDKTTIFEMDPNAKKISFSSEKNDEPSKVQIFMKTPEIKEIVDDDSAIFTKGQEKEGMLSRILGLFKKLFNNIINIFKK